MSDSRLLSLRYAGCVLAVLGTALLISNHADAQAIGSGLLGTAPRPSARGQQVPPGHFVPGHQRSGNGQVPASLTSTVLGRMHTQPYEPHGLEPIPMEGEMLPGPEGHHHGAGDCECGGAGCDACGDACGCGVEGCQGCGGVWRVIGEAFQRMEYYSGATSFSGPINRGGTGSFGFEGGLNLGAPLFGGWHGWGVQAGVGGTLANFNGANITTDNRNQLFVTAGFFRRVDWGLQAGLVFDYLKDEWYASADFSQVRGELSWVMPEEGEFGLMFAAGEDPQIVTGQLQSNTALPTTIVESWQVNDYYGLYYRKTFCNNAQGRFFAGWTGSSDGLLGADVSLPLNESWALRSGVTYIIPEEGEIDRGFQEEFWNVSVQLVWYPHCTATQCDYYRPLLNVANNGSMFVKRNR